MKNKNRGFIAPLLIIIIVFIVIAGGFYYYFLKNKNQQNIINNTNTDISSFVPSNINEIKFDKIQYLSANDQGFILRGLVYFNVIGQESTSTKTSDGNLLTVATPIVLIVFECAKESSTICQKYLTDGIVKNNQDMIQKELTISNKNISYFEFKKISTDSFVKQSAGLVNTDSTTYVWCEGKFCFQVLSYYKFDIITKDFVNGVIDTYSKIK